MKLCPTLTQYTKKNHCESAGTKAAHKMLVKSIQRGEITNFSHKLVYMLFQAKKPDKSTFRKQINKEQCLKN